MRWFTDVAFAVPAKTRRHSRKKPREARRSRATAERPCGRRCGTDAETCSAPSGRDAKGAISQERKGRAVLNGAFLGARPAMQQPAMQQTAWQVGDTRMTALARPRRTRRGERQG